jgi:hypothetical protein
MEGNTLKQFSALSTAWLKRYPQSPRKAHLSEVDLANMNFAIFAICPLLCYGVKQKIHVQHQN